LEDVWQGTYTFRVEANGYGAAETDRAVGPGSTVHDFGLSTITTLVEHDLESTDGGLIASDGWEWGGDAVAGAHSGAGVWGTVLNGSYADGVTWTLDLPAVALPAADGAELSFWQWYDIEDSYDGARIEVSVDGGAFSVVTPSPDYNDQTITAFGNTPGFTGSASWHEVVVDLAPYTDSTVVIRWTFASDSSLHRRGWYLDDLVLTVWGGATGMIFADGFESGSTSAWSAP
jgi:hypothetical protein